MKQFANYITQSHFIAQRTLTIAVSRSGSEERPEPGERIGQPRSPRMRLANCRSLGMIVTRLAWMAQRFVSSKSDTR